MDQISGYRPPRPWWYTDRMYQKRIRLANEAYWAGWRQGCTDEAKRLGEK